jgi:hypothetical protein
MISGNRFWGFNGCDSSHTDRGIKKVMSMGKWSNDITDMSNAFKYCRTFVEVSPYAVKHLVNVTSFSNVFAYTSLVSVSEDLFRYNVNVTNFDSVFDNDNSLISIPENLFKYNTKVTTIDAVFYRTAITHIPKDLFRYNAGITNFGSAFVGTLITSIPEDLFRYNINATDFSHTFYDAVYLTSIPEDLFKYNGKVTIFNDVFRKCFSLKCSDITAAAKNWPRWNAKGVNMTNATYDCKN